MVDLTLPARVRRVSRKQISDAVDESFKGPDALYTLINRLLFGCDPHPDHEQWPPKAKKILNDAIDLWQCRGGYERHLDMRAREAIRQRSEKRKIKTKKSHKKKK